MKKIVLLISISPLLYLSGCSSRKKEKESAGHFTATSPLKTDTSFTREYVAQLQSVRNIEIRAQEKGYLQSISVDEGQYVHAGQLLFRIMPRIFEAEVMKAKAVVKERELDVQNTGTLAAKNIVSGTELAIAKAKLDEAKADLALAEAHLSFTEIRAPFDGIIDRIRLKQGSLVDEGALLTTLSDNRNIYAYFNLPEAEYLNYKRHSNSGSKTGVSLLLANGEKHRYDGLVETAEGEFDSNTGNIAFRAKFPNPENLLRHGETGKVQMTIPEKDALIIPQKATYEIQDKIYVFIIGKNNTVRSKNITIRAGLPDLYVVDSGLSEGDRILLEGVQNVRDGDKVEYVYTDPKQVIPGLQLIK